MKQMHRVPRLVVRASHQQLIADVISSRDHLELTITGRASQNQFWHAFLSRDRLLLCHTLGHLVLISSSDKLRFSVVD